MNRIKISFVIIIIICMISGCSSDNSLLKKKIDATDIDKIQIVTAMGNPQYGAKSKIIADKNEIGSLVDAFNNAVIGDKVKDEDVEISETSRYYFYSADTLVQQFLFNGNDSQRIWYNSNYYYITYSGMSPYELYKSSVAEIIIVDENLIEMETEPSKMFSN